MFALLVLCTLSCSGVSASKILGISLTPSYSHQIVFQPLWRELSLRGHQVTTITPNPINDLKLINLTEIDLGFVRLSNLEVKGLMRQSTFLHEIYLMYTFMATMMDKQLEYPPVKQLLNDRSARFDLVIVEYLWTAPLAFAKRFDCPYIGVLSTDGVNSNHRKIGNPAHSSLYPDLFLSYGDKLSIFERVVSFVYELFYEVYFEGVLHELEQKVVHKHFGDHYPSVAEMARNVSMLFVNSDPIFHHNRPLVPGVVQIGGSHYPKEPVDLPPELHPLDDAEFIYFSLGSNVKSEFLKPQTIDMMLEVFGELPYLVLWKFEEDLPNKPSNVIISRWLPQREVLAHPNIKLFITQGGLQSMDEAIHARVPMLGIPIFFDQPFNVKKMVNRGFGLELDHRTLEKSVFKETILEVIQNPRYRNVLRELADLAEDQPMTGIEKAVWWSEYVIRHKGARHLRSPLLDVAWYQYLLLDVFAVLLVGFFVVIYLIVTVCRLVFKSLKSVTEHKRKND
uniref:UDP-glucuronosyltransferase n=1 Tax=Photinus pyralis TaxID=7054 RepID=A0A1Y1L5Z1_PHOPY